MREVERGRGGGFTRGKGEREGGRKKTRGKILGKNERKNSATFNATKSLERESYYTI